MDEIITFNFSYNENQFYVKKRLNKLLGETQGAIVTDNGLTISSARLFNNPKTIFHLLHDYFYVNENIRLGDMIDIAIAHSSFFSDAVFSSNPSLYLDRTFYIPYGVKQLYDQPKKNNQVLNLVFLGRLDEGKGVFYLYEMECLLKKRNINVNWTIIGKGKLKEKVLQQWNLNKNVSFYEPNTTEEVYNLLSKQDIFVFPTVFEGTPVSILECLANGIVIITNDLPGGIRDIVKEEIGFRCSVNNIEDFANKIEFLNNHRELLCQMQNNCYELATCDYDILNNADNYFSLFLQYKRYRREDKKAVVKMYSLDTPILPNFLVKFIRKIKK